MNEVTLKQYPGISLVKTGAQISWTKNQTKPRVHDTCRPFQV